MGAPTSRRRPTDLPAPELATCDRLTEQHAQLRARGVHDRAGGWIVARPADVTAALGSPVMRVAAPVPAGDPPVGAARALQAQMARFCDGPQHTHRRAVLEQLLPDPSGLDTDAGRRTASVAQDGGRMWDAMPLARTVPVVALAGALGVPTRLLPRVAELVGRVCDALAPALGPPRPGSDGDVPAQELTALIGSVGRWDQEQTSAVAGMLFQARDATAALIGSALLDGAQDPAPDQEPAARVERALRHAAPVQCTRRTPVQDLQLDGVTVPRGAAVWVVLAAAEQGPPSRPATFGFGPHACPGAEHAVALARGVLAGLHTTGWRPVPGQRVRYEPRPNLRMPAAVLVQRP